MAKKVECEVCGRPAIPTGERDGASLTWTWNAMILLLGLFGGAWTNQVMATDKYVTKNDFAIFRTEVRADFTQFKTDVGAEFRDLRTTIRERQ